MHGAVASLVLYVFSLDWNARVQCTLCTTDFPAALWLIAILKKRRRKKQAVHSTCICMLRNLASPLTSTYNTNWKQMMIPMIVLMMMCTVCNRKTANWHIGYSACPGSLTVHLHFLICILHLPLAIRYSLAWNIFLIPLSLLHISIRCYHYYFSIYLFRALYLPFAFMSSSTVLFVENNG